MLPIINNPLVRRQLCYIARKPKGPVLENTIGTAVATSTEKRGFVTSRICRGGPSTSTFMGGMGLSARLAARLYPCFQHPVHPYRLKTVWVGCPSRTGAIHMTQVITLASRRAAPVSPTTPTKAELVQLHASACNDLHMQAMNSLARCGHMLTATEPMYTFAMQDLDAAKAAIAALQLLKGARP